MKPISRLHVIPDLPANLTPLWDLAYNLWWTWNQETMRVLQQIDPDAWVACERNPMRFLSSLSQVRLDELARDGALVRRIEHVLTLFERYRARPTWYDQAHADSGLQISYFSAEFGLTESLRIYSGGLGVLAGDHLKSASDLGLPLVGLGLMYRQGYFHQALNPDGWQAEHYPESNPDHMPVRAAARPDGKPLVIEVPFAQGPVRARLWLVQVGRVPLYLLDTNVEGNAPGDREITARLYGGDREMRIRQEILLGIGGMTALGALGIQPTICHMNEGHSAFLGLERIRTLMREHGLSFAAAREIGTLGNVFTTHTPVAAGNDWFPPDLVEKHLHHYREQLGLSRDEFLGLGRVNPNDQSGDFCMTVLALRLSASANGVSQLHGGVSRRMWSGLWPELDAQEVPIASITNGVHMQSWASLEMAELFDRHLGEDWRYAQPDAPVWERVQQIPDRELWDTHQVRRRRLVEYVRHHLRQQLGRQGVPPAKAELSLHLLDPEALTIGFARRFATYKRGNLIFRNIERLAALFRDRDRPVQILYSGKAHPHDNPGKELIRQIVHLARQEPFAGRVFFLQDYDMNVARFLVQGCDVWLNNPRRPQEASGTSGMKASLNGVLNVSVLDGWWAEACRMHAGWGIGLGEEYEDLTYQDEVESSALYDLLETEVVPLFYTRDTSGLPRGWIARMKETIARLAPYFNTNRMVREYVDGVYLPNHRHWVSLGTNLQRIGQLTRWKAYVRSKWPAVRIAGVEASPPSPLKVGMQVPVKAMVQLGELTPDEVRVELYMGRLNAQHEIEEPVTLPLRHVCEETDGVHVFQGEYPCARPGTHGYTLRVVPYHPDLRRPVELGLARWAG
ncbi:MAG: alpha-glucan family phosphorylase [Candidatus Latescibacterota bacterium]